MKITTIDQLDALPIGSVILDQFVVVSERGWTGWFTTGVEAPDPPHLPATVLFVPGRDLVREAKAVAWDEALVFAEEFVGNARNYPNPYRDEAP